MQLINEYNILNILKSVTIAEAKNFEQTSNRNDRRNHMVLEIFRDNPLSNKSLVSTKRVLFVNSNSICCIFVFFFP